MIWCSLRKFDSANYPASIYNDKSEVHFLGIQETVVWEDRPVEIVILFFGQGFGYFLQESGIPDPEVETPEDVLFAEI